MIGDGSVEILSVPAYGPDAVEVAWKGPNGLGERILYRDDDSRLRELSAGRSFAFDGDGRLFRLTSEALRIRLAYLFDPYLAVSHHSLRLLLTARQAMCRGSILPHNIVPHIVVAPLQK